MGRGIGIFFNIFSNNDNLFMGGVALLCPPAVPSLLKELSKTPRHGFQMLVDMISTNLKFGKLLQNEWHERKHI
jgi:hypothetical protein